MVEPLLSVRNLDVAYGPVTAVRGLSLDVGEAEIVALLGANGAGKTSTLRGISGLVRPRSGRLRFAGRRLEGDPARAVALGMAHVPEGRRVFPGLSVDDHLMLGGWAARRRSAHEQQRSLVFDLFPQLAQRRTRRAGELSGGEQQMLAIGRALMSRPRLLLLDEPSLGLAPQVVDLLYDRLVALNREGLAILLVEQFVDRALDVAGRAYVLARGRVAFAGEPAEVTRARALDHAYLLGTTR